ncbi:MAG: hemolysin III family protein, partial [Oscillospiraceae bacterium]|nr:hemolysin III family protein [Oscillospiraceae bacterium]
LRKGTAKKVMQIIDHCTIYILIAGTYTPFCLCVLREYKTWLGWTVFGTIWGLAILGIVLNAIDLKSFRIISMVLYIGMGWCIIFTVKILFQYIGVSGMALLVSGGIAYTIGAILYGMGRKLKWMHSIFHIFVVIGSVCHSLSIILCLM